MKFIILAVIALAVGLTNAAESGLSEVVRCPLELSRAVAGDCKRKLEERLELVERAENEVDQLAPSMFRCCYFTEYVHCVSQEVKPYCGNDVSSMVETRVTALFKNISGKCQDYNYSSPQCILVVWFNTII